MKYSKYISIIAATALLTACDSKLDIVPLGETTLDTVEELETLLNQVYLLNNSTSVILEVAACTSYPRWQSIDEDLAVKNSLNYAMMTFDETVDRADLTDKDQIYADLYAYINYCNVVISKAPDATGTESLRNQIIAEAHLLRAYLHYLVANIYAGQYDAATADKLGCIAYVDNTNVQEQKTKLSIAKVYEKLLADTDDKYLEDLIVKDSSDPCRIGKDFGYAVRAMVLTQMKRYDEALPYALKAIEVNPNIEDRSGILSNKGEWALEKNAPNNYLYINGLNGYGSIYGLLLARETAVHLDPNDYNCYEPDGYNPRKYTIGWDYDDGLSSFGLDGVPMSKNSWSAYFNNWGVRSEQIYYIAAECYIRQGNIAKGFEYMDKVLVNRIVDYQPLSTIIGTSLSTAEAMEVLMSKKVIEVMGSYVNLFDRKRWNTEDAYKRNYTRNLDDYGTYTCTPESPLWILPFPKTATNYNSSLTQNY